MGGWVRWTSLVVLVTISPACAGWTFGPAGVRGGAGVAAPGGGEAFRIPSSEDQGFGVFVGGLAIFGVFALLVQLPIAASMDDWIWSAPLAGPYVRWEQTASCPPGTNCMGAVFNLLGILITLGELGGLILATLGMCMEPGVPGD